MPRENFFNLGLGKLEEERKLLGVITSGVVFSI